MDAGSEAVKAIVAKETWTAEDHQDLLKRLFEINDSTRKFQAMLAEMEAAHPEPSGSAAVKIGIARYMLCRFPEAIEALANGTDNKDRRYFQAQCCKQLRQYDKAIEELQRAKDRGWEPLAIDLEVAENKALGGDLDGAEKDLGRLEGKAGPSASWLYIRGLVDELRGYGERAVEAYQKARAVAPHPEATFRLAYYLDLHGDEEQAIELYQQCLSSPPVHVNALMNLAVIYEDAGNYSAAAACLRRVLQRVPHQARARLFLKDVEASRSMYYDEDQAKQIARRNAILDIPVTDFELSVRARNCLKKMNIFSLGDLVRTTEADLLAYKNFGETSLKEIKDMLTAKGLHLGQALEEGSEFQKLELPKPPEESGQGVLATPIEQVEFSVRARRALESLNVKILGDLSQKTEAELLACRNFGQTSLNEVKQRLAEYGLRLRETS